MSSALIVLLTIIFEAKNEDQLLNTFYLKFELLKDLTLNERKVFVRLVLLMLSDFQKRSKWQKNI